MTFFPYFVCVATTPKEENYQDKAAGDSERKLNEGSLCSFDGFFQEF